MYLKYNLIILTDIFQLSKERVSVRLVIILLIVCSTHNFKWKAGLIHTGVEI